MTSVNISGNTNDTNLVLDSASATITEYRGNPSDTANELGFDSARFTALHTVSANWPSLPYIYKVKVPLEAVKNHDSGVFGVTNVHEHPSISQVGLYAQNGTQLTSATQLMDPLSYGTDDGTGRPYMTITPHAAMDILDDCDNCPTKHVYVAVVGVIRFAGDDPINGYFKDIVALGNFIFESGSNTIDARLSKRLLMRSTNEGIETINGVLHSIWEYELKEIPTDFDIKLYSTQIPHPYTTSLIG